MSDQIDQIDLVIRRLQEIRNEIESKQDSIPVIEDGLIDRLESIDLIYRDFCAELDMEYEDELGTQYKSASGPNVEFYIEADDWHAISLLLRMRRISGAM